MSGVPYSPLASPGGQMSEVGKTKKSQAPSTKAQISTKHQITITKQGKKLAEGILLWKLVLGIWKLFGHWCLRFCHCYL
jgi:hypothetical protein